jgi:hypothetical protein
MNETCSQSSVTCCYCCAPSSDSVVSEAQEDYQTMDYCLRPAHLKSSPNSDHNTGLAVDLTHDPDNGIDCTLIFEKLKEDERVSYLIFNKKIWARAKAKSGNRPYSGSNPHTKHLHISINADKSNDTSPWFWWMNQPTVLNQVVANLQPKPKKKVAKGFPLPPQPKAVCTCCKVHTFEINRKAI